MFGEVEISLTSAPITFELLALNNSWIISFAPQNDNPHGTGVPVAGTRKPSNPSISKLSHTGPERFLI